MNANRLRAKSNMRPLMTRSMKWVWCADALISETVLERQPVLSHDGIVEPARMAAQYATSLDHTIRKTLCAPTQRRQRCGEQSRGEFCASTSSNLRS
jgi:hypothetical protein